jgi:UDP-N-acetylglucosamine 2-epimerase (non-hydrolysing)
MRPNTERPVTIDLGTNVLVERRRDQIVELSERALNGEWKPHSIPEGWDGKAALRIEEQLARWLQSS